MPNAPNRRRRSAPVGGFGGPPAVRRPEAGVRPALGTLHVVHLLLVVALYRDLDWRFGWGGYAYLLAATYAVASPPRRASARSAWP